MKKYLDWVNVKWSSPFLGHTFLCMNAYIVSDCSDGLTSPKNITFYVKFEYLNIIKQAAIKYHTKNSWIWLTKTNILTTINAQKATNKSGDCNKFMTWPWLRYFLFLFSSDLNEYAYHCYVCLPPPLSIYLNFDRIILTTSILLYPSNSGKNSLRKKKH